MSLSSNYERAAEQNSAFYKKKSNKEGKDNPTSSWTEMSDYIYPLLVGYKLVAVEGGL